MSIEEILLYLANNNFSYQYVIVFFILTVISLSLPVPYTLIIISNVYVFGWLGFFIVILSIPLGSFITYIYIKKFYQILLKINFFKKLFKNKLINKINFKNNIYLLVIARATLPFYLVSVAFALMNISIKKFLNITIIGTFLNTLLVSLIIISVRESITNYNEFTITWDDPRFFLPLIILVLFVYISKKFNLKLYDEKK